MAEKTILTKEQRRAKKEARRAKQREGNIARARKMHITRLEAETQLKMPESNLSKDPVPEGQNYYVGCSGWFYWHWRGLFYPDGMPTKDWFGHYADTFKTVELNAPFYSWPTVAAVNTWLRQAESKPFIYTVKVCELITHIKRFKDTKELVRDFGYIADVLGTRMRCFLFQLPPGYHYTPERLKDILDQLDHKRRNVLEFRHKSWWNDEVYEAFRATGTIFCSCSGPGLPDELIKTANDIYVRFHGTLK